MITKRRIMQLADGKAEDQLALLPYGNPEKALAVQTSDLALAVKKAKVDSMIFRKIAAKRYEVAAENVIAWRSKGAFANRDKFATAIPSVAPFVPALHSEPPIAGADFVVSYRSPLGLQVPRIMGLQSFHVGNLKQFMDRLVQHWNEMHFVIKHDEQKALPSEPKPNYKVKPSCLEAQFCLCGSDGDEIWALKLWLCTAMKRAMPTAEMHPDIDEGSVILRFTGFDMALPNDFTTDDKQGPDDSQVFDLFVHISFMSWNPYRPTFRRVSWPGRKVDHLDRLHLMATHTYHSMLAFLSDLVAFAAMSVVMQCYGLSDSDELLPELNPAWVVASRLPSSTVQVKALRKAPKCVDPQGAIVDADPGWDAALQQLLDEPAVDEQDEGVLSDDGRDDEAASHLEESVMGSDVEALDDMMGD